MRICHNRRQGVQLKCICTETCKLPKKLLHADMLTETTTVEETGHVSERNYSIAMMYDVART